ncbi:Mitochondrial Translation Optimization, partial [Spiromyces aspiralis]
EPYRVFTARSEYRLSARADNADMRLTRKAAEVGIVANPERLDRLRAVEAAMQEGLDMLESITKSPHAWTDVMQGTPIAQDGRIRSALDLVRMGIVSDNEAGHQLLASLAPGWSAIDPHIRHRLLIEAKYHSYLKRQKIEIDTFRRDESLPLPLSLDFSAITALSREEQELLNKARPDTIGAAKRVSGITPGGILTLLKYVDRSTIQTS